MWRDSVVRRVVASVLSVALLLQVSGCTGWSTQQQPPAQLLAEKSYTKLRVTRINDKRVEVYSPRIVDDTLVGYRSLPVEGKEGEAKPVSIALADIKSVEVHKVQTGKTVLLVIGIGLTVALIVAAASADYGIGSGGGGGGEYYGSCPLLYSWDGKNWRLDSGTFGGAIMPALQRTDLDNLVYVKPQANTLRLRIVNELEETEYVDALSIVAVDHRPGVSVLPDANGSPELHAVASPAAPIVAQDDAGRNMLGHVRASDGVFWESPLRTRDPASPADVRDGVQMTFKRPQGGASTLLVLEAQNTPWSAYLMTQLVRAWGRNVAQWYDRATSATVAKQVAPALADGAFLMVQVRVNGQWETRGRVFETGPEVAKRVALPLDLTGVTGETVEVRLESIPNFWLVDYAALGIADSSPFRTRELELTSAVRSDGDDVRQLLALEDQSFFVMEQGEQAELTVAVPPVSPGRLRSYLAKTSGWYRIHGAESADPDRALLEKVAAPQGASRAAIQLTNDALARLR